MWWSGYVGAIMGLMAYTGLALAASAPSATIPANNVTYRGIHRNDIEVFLNIPYGKDTGGNNRFKPPRPHIPAPGSIINADSYGPACPQALGGWIVPLSLTNVTEISEDCLNLNIARPKATKPHDGFPVMVYIHGGSFWAGSNQEITTAPDGLILESVKNGYPVIHVVMNYRLGGESRWSIRLYGLDSELTRKSTVFGFAQSAALKSEGSENAGLRDQRLAIEWVRDNIAHFGGNPNKITIFGQSSGGM